ncbi:hypothetical protein SODALDRAFT_363740 [Sodiomyces alkalinus F11]|uniref:Uncharacterized protein n=1 Tax=Sodiomyces alkalinus (strain CBS 110278 / VKM F-3762 / F11) TaxID=1314773 RepID=A0A3N2PKK7_SODAK|nr:hypothetical protein SODALDRAFT_363740 [Sodiomyces alkalinus F11]ROT35053.1 hypothetical protein SODALDRAFT_363740 [Sodiomyces alkalinus F11]
MRRKSTITAQPLAQFKLASTFQDTGIRTASINIAKGNGNTCATAQTLSTAVLHIATITTAFATSCPVRDSGKLPDYRTQRLLETPLPSTNGPDIAASALLALPDKVLRNIFDICHLFQARHKVVVESWIGKGSDSINARLRFQVGTPGDLR